MRHIKKPIVQVQRTKDTKRNARSAVTRDMDLGECLLGGDMEPNVKPGIGIGVLSVRERCVGHAPNLHQRRLDRRIAGVADMPQLVTALITPPTSLTG